MKVLTNDEFLTLYGETKDGTLDVEFNILLAMLTTKGCHILESKLTRHSMWYLRHISMCVGMTENGYEVINGIDTMIKSGDMKDINSHLIMANKEIGGIVVPTITIEITFSKDTSINSKVPLFKEIISSLFIID